MLISRNIRKNKEKVAALREPYLPQAKSILLQSIQKLN
jgi:hypothetical protein